jgi:hypothetical protein
MRTKNKFTEASATKYLRWVFFHGCATSYLGWRFPVRLVLDDGTEKIVEPAGPRIWPTPIDEKRIRWNPVFEHLKGLPRGVCRGRGETFLPFVAVDLDRHDGNAPARPHIEAVLKAGRILNNDPLSG